MQIGDPAVILLNERHGVLVCGRDVTGIKIDSRWGLSDMMITNPHLKDRKKNGGQYEYPGKGDCIADAKKCLESSKRALA
jgi:hypothetical protein